MTDLAGLLDWPLLGPLLRAEQGGITFFEALPILKNGLLACLVCAVLSAYLGVLVIVRRIVFVSVAVSQVSSFGLAAALFVAPWLGYKPLAPEESSPSMVSAYGVAAVASAMVAASLAARQNRDGRLSRESLLGIAYVLPGALVWLILHQMAGESHLIDNVLFGNAIFVSTPQLVALTGVALAVATLHGVFFKAFNSAAFEPTVAAAEGLPVALYDQLFYAALAVAIALMIGTIGVMPVFGFMVLPAAGALLLGSRLSVCLALSVGLGLVAALGGFYASFLWALPTGPLMIAVAGLTVLPGLVLRAVRGA